MRRIFFAIIAVLLVNTGLVLAHEHNFAETKQLIDSGVSCEKLTDEQLEAIGEYYMEQMHPGEAHELMDTMMGGEGSESLKQAHIQMAKRLYCTEDAGGMMGMMGGGMMNMMMGGGMMGNYPTYYGYGYDRFWSMLWLIFWIGVIALIIWIISKLTGKRNESERNESETPVTILQKRYAKGEINKKQFEEMKKEIRG